MPYKSLRLDVKGTNESEAHNILMEFLEKQGLTGKSFLYRGTDSTEVKWLASRAKRPVESSLEHSLEDSPIPDTENSIFAYTYDEMCMLGEGNLGIDNKSPIEHAGYHDKPCILVYNLHRLIRVDDEGPGRIGITSFEYRFRDYKTRAEALAARIALIM